MNSHEPKASELNMDEIIDLIQSSGVDIAHGLSPANGDKIREDGKADIKQLFLDAARRATPNQPITYAKLEEEFNKL